MKKYLLLLLLTLLVIITPYLFSPNYLSAASFPPQSYVTVVIPFRGRDYWRDLSNVTPLFDYLSKQNIPATILLQYQNLNDHQVIDYLKTLPFSIEIGLFLEVDESLANDSFASFLYGIGDKAH